MVVGLESFDGARFYGFHFDPNDLPVEYQPQERWQEYLIDRKTAGFISGGPAYGRKVLSVDSGAFHEKKSPCAASIEAVLPPPEEWARFADYSYSLDDFHSDADPRYNCVTWAIMISNQVVAGFLKPVRQG
jgi:hypothetical protein